MRRWPKRYSWYGILTFTTDPRCPVGKYLGFDFNNIGFSSGKHHRHLRKLCATQLLPLSRLSKYSGFRCKEIVKMIKYVCKSSHRGKMIGVRNVVTDLTRNIICQMLMGDAHREVSQTSITFKHDSFESLVQEVMEVAGNIGMGDLIPALKWLDLQGKNRKMKRLQSQLVKFLGLVIEKHKQQPQEPTPGYIRGEGQNTEDLIDLLLSFKDEDKLSDNAIMGILLDMMVGGIDTSSCTIEWALAELVRNPPMLERVQCEMDEVVGRDCLVEETDLVNLPYLQAVVKETLRLHPAMPLSLPHMNLVPAPLTNYRIPGMTTVVLNYGAIGRDPDTWQDPLQFNPERFMKLDLSILDDNFQFLPFGYGIRGCPGENLGLLLVQFALASLVQGFDWAPGLDQIPHDIDLVESFGVVCGKANRLIVSATPRLPLHLYKL